MGLPILTVRKSLWNSSSILALMVLLRAIATPAWRWLDLLALYILSLKMVIFSLSRILVSFKRMTSGSMLL